MEVLTSTQTKALCLIAAGYSLEDVANKTGVSIRTLSRWKNSKNFRNQLNRVLDECFNLIVAELIEGGREAVQELKRIITDPDVPARVRVGAINVLLSNLSKVITQLRPVSEEPEENQTEYKIDSNDPVALAAEYRRIIQGK